MAINLFILGTVHSIAEDNLHFLSNNRKKHEYPTLFLSTTPNAYLQCRVNEAYFLGEIPTAFVKDFRKLP